MAVLVVKIKAQGRSHISLLHRHCLSEPFSQAKKKKKCVTWWGSVFLILLLSFHRILCNTFCNGSLLPASDRWIGKEGGFQCRLHHQRNPSQTPQCSRGPFPRALKSEFLRSGPSVSAAFKSTLVMLMCSQQGEPQFWGHHHRVGKAGMWCYRRAAKQMLLWAINISSTWNVVIKWIISNFRKILGKKNRCNMKEDERALQSWEAGEIMIAATKGRWSCSETGAHPGMKSAEQKQINTFTTKWQRFNISPFWRHMWSNKNWKKY